ncbi:MULTISPECIES: SDR family NAD(P)-dependent oxidoreductase [unclassified Pseudomonas]|uniref:SDR family oxidoreductase n=1 Tax=unclassified Pseudomonas TaxID=196821 RepID=UPI00244C31D3|nr:MULTISPECIES: SDR family NAD(P)-dependent oxidoreductase [unclassified Pseudomonas]MDH0304738.1 SDR family oxidoreductase [Pseudomonas sp. GD04091]MDH1988178.1 SDR family oxidoreductase [Pseudomonas sp. GD03689]
MRILVVGASKGLGRALVEGLGGEGDTLIGVSRTRPASLPGAARWIEADLGQPWHAAAVIHEAVAGAGLDVLVYNVGIWEERAFEDGYSFLDDDDGQIQRMVDTNITAPLLLIKRLLPVLLQSDRPRIILTGSTSGLPGSGRPEVTFGASKFGLRGIAESLREGFRDRGLGVSCLNLGYLNTEDGLQVPLAEAERRGEGTLIPLHDVVQVCRMMLNLSSASYVRDITLPALRDERF